MHAAGASCFESSKDTHFFDSMSIFYALTGISDHDEVLVSLGLVLSKAGLILTETLSHFDHKP